MTRTRRIALAGLLAAVAVTTAAGCTSPSDDGKVPGAPAHTAAAGHAANTTAPAGGGSTQRQVSGPTQHQGGTPTDPPATGTPAGPEFANTTVYGEVRSVHTDAGVVSLVWDKGDWTFAPKAAGMIGHLRSCQRREESDVLTNCSSELRTTVVPTSTPIGVQRPDCLGHSGTTAPDPWHPRHALGGHRISVQEFTDRAQRGCGGAPAPGFDSGFWLTFDGAGKLVRLDEKFKS